MQKYKLLNQLSQMEPDNKIFDFAASFVKHTNRHVFLTGKAGTGKTTFLRFIQQHCGKKMAIVAPTGVAAINAGGVTIHSFFQLPLGTYIHNYRPAWGESESYIFNRNQLLSKLRIQQSKRTLLRELELLIIDEISMVRADTLDAIDTVLRSIRRRPDLPFGGVQLLYIGDLFQLPPVVRQQEKALLDEVYKSPFFFDALVMQESEPLYIELKKIYRQHDDVFINILHNIRNNVAGPEDMDILHEHYNPNFVPYPEDRFITLTSHNYQADAINKQELERLSSKVHLIEATIEKDFPENAYPAEKTLRLKEGAQIMFIRNDKGEKRRFYNGKIGTIERIEKSGAKILVRFKDEPELLEMEKETWQNIRYRYNMDADEIDEETLGTFTQFPIRLAWAVTIHKSQGLTFEKAIVDAGRSFAPGQVYVALSRLTALDGLVLRSRIGAGAIITDERVLEFSRNDMNDESLQQVLSISQKEYVADSLLRAFEMEKITAHIALHFQDTNFSSLPTGDEALQWTSALNTVVQNIGTTAKKFHTQLNQYLQQGATMYPQLHERVKAATEWFEKNMDEQAIKPLQEHIAAMQVKQRTKKYVKEVDTILQMALRKKIQIQQARVVTENIIKSDNWKAVIESVSSMNAPVIPVAEKREAATPSAETDIPKVNQKGATKLISLGMYREGKTIEAIASERSMAVSTIVGHLTEFIGSGEIDVSVFVSAEKLRVITEVLKSNPDTGFGVIKNLLGEAYSYPEIKAAFHHLHYLAEKEQQKSESTVDAVKHNKD